MTTPHAAHVALRSAAVTYARLGWPVLPLQARQKTPNARLAPHGLQNATTDLRQIWSWWQSAPRGNVGIRTGLGLDVLDVDSEEALNRLLLELGHPISSRVIVRTAHGWHFWFASSGLRSRAGILPGVDVRGVGGYVVAPPSLHPSGTTYRFIDPATGELLGRLPALELSPVPADLLALLAPRRRTVPRVTSEPPRRTSAYVAAALARETQNIAATAEGSRNDRLNRSAFALGTLVGAGVLEYDRAAGELLAAAARAGLGEFEASRTIASGLSAGARHPRELTSVTSPT